jgi:predicted GNAT family acetyltransferase
LAQTWGAAASLDSGIAALDGNICVRLIGTKQLYFWTDDQPRCMLGVLLQTQHSTAVGIVYTPAAYRGRGHAATAIAAFNELARERGIDNRFLFINPDKPAAVALSAKLRCETIQDTVDIDWR